MYLSRKPNDSPGLMHLASRSNSEDRRAPLLPKIRINKQPGGPVGVASKQNRDKNKSISRPVQRYEVRSQVFSSSQDNRVGVRIEVPGAATVVNSRNLPSTWLRKSVRRGWEGSWDSLRCFGGGGWGWTHGHVDAC